MAAKPKRNSNIEIAPTFLLCLKSAPPASQLSSRGSEIDTGLTDPEFHASWTGLSVRIEDAIRNSIRLPKPYPPSFSV